jgi:hypothetical protein
MPNSINTDSGAFKGDTAKHHCETQPNMLYTDPQAKGVQCRYHKEFLLAPCLGHILSAQTRAHSRLLFPQSVLLTK